MFKKLIISALCIVVVSQSFAAGIVPTMRTQDIMAISHDGNNWDKDDTYAFAMDWAVMWAFGFQKMLVHNQINNLLQKDNNAEFNAQMQLSREGYKYFPGFDSSIVKDCNLDNGKAAVAHFASLMNNCSADKLMYFIVCGPMEVPWQSINATAKEKRKFIRVLSHSYWNEDHTGGGGLLTHTFTNMMQSFGTDGVQFYGGERNGYTNTGVTIPDQNNNLGGGGSANWNGLLSIGSVGGTTPATWTWLKGRDFKANGDCSDNGLVWIALTGNTKANAATYIAKFKTPDPMKNVGIVSKANLVTKNMNFADVTQNGRVLNVSLPESNTNGSVVVYNLLSQVVFKGSMVNGKAALTIPSATVGKYLISIKTSLGSIHTGVILK